MRGMLLALIAFAPLAATAGVDPGETAFSHCFSCHSVDPKETDMPGPNLFGVLCRKPGAQAGFLYSDGMKTFARTHTLWTATLLDQYLADPQAMVPKSPMELPPQLKSAEVRRDVIAYLKQHAGDAAKACPR